MRRATLARFSAGLLLGIASAGDALGAGDPAADAPLNVRVFDLQGLDWRSKHWDRFTHVGRDGAATVWVVDARAAGAIAGSASAEVKLGEGGKTPGHVRSANDEIKFVSGLDRIADGPKFGATRVAFLPKVEGLPVRTEGVVKGRRRGGTVRAEVDLRDDQIAAVHAVACPDGLKPKPGVSKGMWGGVLGWLGWGGPTRISGTVQVPEVISSQVRGDWEIPAGKALVIGLGVHSLPRGWPGEGDVRERVVVIDAGDLDPDAYRAGRASSPTAPGVHDHPFQLATAGGWAAVVALAMAASGFAGWRLRGPVGA